ncbi:MAG: hypothetical protein N3G21_12305 [Candidatus Hydrogenedentes bacterium]|nr:hypothetical protein [Candidatus Hydrogenedentota bacterium]
MIKIYRIITIGLSLMSILGSAMAENTLDDAIAKIETAWQKLTTLKADISASANLPINETYLKLKGMGELLIARDKEKEKFVQKISAYPASLIESGNTSILSSPMATAQILFDGTDYYVTYKLLANQETNKTQPDLTKGAIPPGGKKLFDTIKERLNIIFTGEKELDGKKTLTFKLTPKDSSDFAEANLTMDTEFGIIRKLEIMGKDNTPLFTNEYTNVKTGIDIPPDTFAIPVSAQPTQDVKQNTPTTSQSPQN